MVVYRDSGACDTGGLAKPCLSCALLLRECGFIRTIYYSDPLAEGGFAKVSASQVCEGASLLRSQRNGGMVKKILHAKRASFV